MLGAEPGEHYEQWRGVGASVVQPEWNLVQRSHLAAAHFMQNFSRFGIGKRIEFARLQSREPL